MNGEREQAVRGEDRGGRQRRPGCLSAKREFRADGCRLPPDRASTACGLTSRVRLLLPLLLAIPLAAQTPIRPRTITEFSLGTRLSRSGEEASPFTYNDGKMMMVIGLGRVTPVGARTSAGGVFSLGIQDGVAYLAIGPRLRYHASTTTTIDVTPGVTLARGDELAGPFLLDAAVMHKDKIGLSIQAAAGKRRIWTALGPEKDVSSTSLAAGLRLGGKPGRIGGAVAVVSVATAIVLFLAALDD